MQYLLVFRQDFNMVMIKFVSAIIGVWNPYTEPNTDACHIETWARGTVEFTARFYMLQIL